MREHVSFSELRIHHECTHRHKLEYVDEMKEFKGNIYTAFGSAIHALNENLVIDHNIDKAMVFAKAFSKEIQEISEHEIIKNSTIREMTGQAAKISEHVLSALEEKFPGYEVFSVEEELYEKIDSRELYFKGYIDLVLKTPDGKYHIIDWKSCSWGWKSRKKYDTVIGYQLILYKWFWAAKHGLSPYDIECHFGLLKRTAKRDPIELFRITSGMKKINNCLTFLNNAIINMERKVYVKNRLSCKYCPFHRTTHCT